MCVCVCVCVCVVSVSVCVCGDRAMCCVAFVSVRRPAVEEGGERGEEVVVEERIGRA